MAFFLQETLKGGIADGSKSGYGTNQSMDDGLGVDYRSDHDKTTALKQLKKESSTTVTDLIKWMVERGTETYHYGDSGKIYKRTSAGSWSNLTTISSSNGQGLGVFNDALWYATSDGLGKATELDSTPVFTDNYLKSVDKDVIASADTSGNTYTIPTSITETAANEIEFTPSVDYISRFTVDIATAGSADIICTVHDASNNVITTQTIASGSVNAGGLIFDFEGGFSVTSGNTYHIHLTSSTADTTVTTGTASDLSTATYAIAKSLNDFDTDQFNPVTLTSVQSSNLVTLGTSISEDTTDKIEFTPNKRTLDAVTFKVNDSNTGNITLTIHNAQNETIGSVTKNSSTFTNLFDGYIRFEFSTPLELTVGATYHMHLVDSAGTAAVQSSSTDFDDAYYLTHYAILQPDDDYHMMKEFTNLLCIGNGRFLATLDDSEVYDSERLVFSKGEKIRCLEVIGDYLAIATWKGDDIGDHGESKIYFWNGTSLFYTSFIIVDGQVNAMKNDGNNALYILHGTEGRLSVYTGGITQVRKLKDVGENKTIEVYPQAMTTWEGLLRFGISDGTSTEVARVIYTYGRKDKDFPRSLSKDYPISVGDTDNGVQIGAILGLNASTFLVSWKNDSTYGVDIIDTANDQTTTNFETLRIDAGDPNKEKIAKTVSIRFAPLATDQSIKVYYDVNNSGSYILLGTADTAGSIYKSFAMPNNKKRFFEIQIKVELIYSDAGSQTDAPEFYSLEIEIDKDGKVQMGEK